MAEIAGVVGFIAAMLLILWAVTGAYAWLRWGFTGVHAIWARRKRIDEIVERDVEEVLR